MPTYTQRTANFPQSAIASSLAITTVAIGDVVLISTQMNSSSDSLASIGDSNNRITWGASALVTDTAFSRELEIWMGTVTSIGTTTVTPVPSVGTVAVIDIDSWSPPAGYGVPWTSVNVGTSGPESATTPWLFAQVESAANAYGGVYWSYLFSVNLDFDTANGVSPYGYYEDADGNGLSFYGILASSTEYQASGNQGSDSWFGVGVIVQARPATSVTLMPHPLILSQGVGRASNF